MISNQDAMEKRANKTSNEDQKLAMKSLRRIKSASRQFTTNAANAVHFKLQEDTEYIAIPKNAFTLLETILTEMSEGKSITVISTEAELSTQQAADFLKISRPHLIKLLQSKIIPHKMVGSHRRVRLADIEAYENKMQGDRAEQLQFLTDQAQTLNLGY